MPAQLTNNQDELKQYIKFIESLPKAYQRAVAGFLNSLAFEGLKEIRKSINNEMVVRTPALLKRATRVDMAKKNAPLQQQQSRMGSIITPRHDGWEHVQRGSSTRMTVFTEEGRGGAFSGKAKPAAKAVPSRHTQPRDYRLKGSGEDRMSLYLQRIASDKQRRRKPFFLPRRFKSMQKGIYKFKGGRVGTYRSNTGKRKGTLTGASIVKLSQPGEQFTPRKIDWMGKALRRTVATPNLVRFRKESLDREVKKEFKKRFG